MNILIVRLGALGDVVHAIPAAAALRAALPDARIDWLVDAKHRAIVDLVTASIASSRLNGRSIAGWAAALRRLRAGALRRRARFPGADEVGGPGAGVGRARVAGFSIWHLREKTARPFYSETSAARATTTPGMSSGRTCGCSKSSGYRAIASSSRWPTCRRRRSSACAQARGTRRSRSSIPARRGRTSAGRRSASASSRHSCATCAALTPSCCGARERKPLAAAVVDASAGARDGAADERRRPRRARRARRR